MRLGLPYAGLGTEHYICRFVVVVEPFSNYKSDDCYLNKIFFFDLANTHLILYDNRA